MKNALASLALLAVIPFASGCATTGAPAAATLTPATQLAGTPCDPPVVVAPSIRAYMRGQFDTSGAAKPPAPVADFAVLQKAQAEAAKSDWPALCYYRADNAALAVQPVPADRVVFMGDSITQGWQFANEGFFGPSRVNRGISGQTTPQMLLRFSADVLALKPRVVHFLGGINDVAGNTGPTTLEDVENNVMAMVELAKAHGIEVILATPTPATKFNWAPKLQPREAVAAYDAWIRSYAAREGLILADYFTPMATHDGAMKPELTLDGVHPNKAGYNVMEPVTKAAIEQALKR